VGRDNLAKNPPNLNAEVKPQKCRTRDKNAGWRLKMQNSSKNKKLKLKNATHDQT